MKNSYEEFLAAMSSVVEREHAQAALDAIWADLSLLIYHYVLTLNNTATSLREMADRLEEQVVNR